MLRALNANGRALLALLSEACPAQVTCLRDGDTLHWRFPGRVAGGRVATPAWPVQPGGAAPRARNAGRRGGACAAGRPVQFRPGRAVRTLAGAGRTCAALPGLPVPGAGVAAGYRSPGAPDFAAGVRPRSGRARQVGRQPAPVCRRIPWRRGGGFRVAGGRRTGRQLPGRPGRCELCSPGGAPAGPREGRRRVQIVPSRSFSMPCADPWRAYRQLCLRNPSPYRFFLDAGTSACSALRRSRH